MESKAEPVLEGPRAVGRPWIRRGLVLTLGLAAGSIAVLAIWIFGVRNVGGLPDVGDPFDVALARQPIVIPDADNAYVLYTEAKQKLLRLPAALHKVDLKTLTWATAGDEVRDFTEQNRPALEAWREGTGRPDALYNQPGKLAVDTLLPVVQELRLLASLAALEGSRHEEKAEMEEAWRWYRATLRSSRHVGRHGVIIERLVGAVIHETAARRILHWAADPRVDARLLRQALDDTLAADAMTPPVSETLKLEYLMYLRDMQELRVMVDEIPLPGGRFGLLEQIVAATGAKPQVQRFRLQATNDVERSRRALRLVFANWLAQVDKPVSDRAAIAIRKPTLIYAGDPSAPPAARALDPEILDKAIDQTSLAQVMLRPVELSSGGGTPMTKAPWEGDGLLAREPRRRAVLIVKLAAELYRREHGRPPKTGGVLLGSYLKELPYGIQSNDAIPATLE
jgi:hypothetical protein